MNHRVTKVVSQAFLCLLAMSMWMAVATPKAHAAQLSGTDKAVPNRHQEPQPPELQDSGISWSSGWSYGGRGILSRLGQENLDSGLGFTVESRRFTESSQRKTFQLRWTTWLVPSVVDCSAP